MRPSEPNVARECANATQARGSCLSEGDHHGSAQPKKAGAVRSHPPRAKYERRRPYRNGFSRVQGSGEPFTGRTMPFRELHHFRI